MKGLRGARLRLVGQFKLEVGRGSQTDVTTAAELMRHGSSVRLHWDAICIRYYLKVSDIIALPSALRLVSCINRELWSQGT